MKKIIFLGFVCFLAFHNCNAQNYYYGADLGVNAFSGTYVYKNGGNTTKEKGTFKPGFEFGGVIGFPVCPHSDIETGLIFSTRGYKYENGTETSNVTVDYLEIPAIADYRFKKHGCGQPFVYGGLYIGFDIGGKEKWTNTYPGNTTSGTDKLKFGNDPMKDQFRPFDYGIKLGIGYKLDNPFSVRLDYSQGLANTLPGGNSDKKYHNYGFTLSATYTLNNKIKSPAPNATK